MITKYSSISMGYEMKRKLTMLKVEYHFSTWDEFFSALLRNNEKLVDLIK